MADTKKDEAPEVVAPEAPVAGAIPEVETSEPEKPAKAPKAESKVAVVELKNQPGTKPDGYQSEFFSALYLDSGTKIGILPTGWVGEPPLIITPDEVGDLKKLLGKL